jgi:DNA (cytosine-5)-methyltransferase 1
MGQRLNPFGVLQVVHLVSQDLSIAGKRAGLAGARSGLFMEQVRIVKEMREADKRNGRTGDMVRPRYLVWENVVGAFSSNRGRDFHAVLEEIARIAEPGFSLSGLPEKWKWTKAGAIDGDGWSIAWRTHDAKDWGKTIRDSRTGNVIRLGTPQRRRRISVVADFGGESAAQIQFDRESVSGHPAESGAAGEGFAEAAEAGASYAVRIRGGCDGGGKGALVQTEKSGTLGTGNDQTIFCLQGNGIDRADTAGCNGKGWREDACYTLNTIDRPAVCAEVRCLTPWEAQSARVYDQDGVWHSLNANENGGMARDSVMCEGNKPAVVAPAAMAFDTTQITSKENRSQPEFGKPCHTLNANAHAPCVELDMTHACDVIRECGEQVPALQARMGTGGNQVPLTYQMNGFGDYRAAEVASSCKQRDFKDSTDLAITHMVVRRLTPMECERLQGFPDHWTDIGEWTDEKGKKHKDADSPRYKALGNSIALPFWDWMLRRMARYLPEDATLGSLFDGIAGFPLIWERIHGRGTARWASEIEPFPIAVTKKWFGEE